MEYLILHPSTIAVLLHALIVVALSARVVMNRPATGVALAWILLISTTPVVGAAAYLLIGERRIGRRRFQGIKTLRVDFREVADAAIQKRLTAVDWSRHSPEAQRMDKIGRRLVGLPTVCGCNLDLMSNTQAILKAIVNDIDSAKTSVLMEFYIWNAGGTADEVLEAVIRAARRGVVCCVLIDAIGARPWWRSRQPQRLREAGVQLRPALQVGIFRTFVGRTDLRLHRKIVVIDGSVAWTGSMNLVDPRFFKQDSAVGQWVDAMVRATGSVVVPLAATMIGDWILESGEPLRSVLAQTQIHMTEPNGSADVQVLPSGPGESGDAQLQMVLALINSASDEAILTTPYLVPDESLLRAIRGAAARGVVVRLIVPEKVDSLLTRYASRSYFDDLLECGVEVYLFGKGLLHTKSITVDRARSMFGTVNLDMRSFWLNYEVALFVYDDAFSAALRSLQASYIADSEQLTLDSWPQRSTKERFLENAFRLASPLL
jgi:cardiolipin synthase